MAEKYVLQMQQIEKEYDGNKVLKGVSFDVRPGEVIALVGENGAGKSTLMNVLFGMPVIHNTGGFTGKVFFEGEEVIIQSPQHAMDLGIGMVHQEFMLIPGFTISENIKLNREKLKENALSKLMGNDLRYLDMDAMNRDARAALAKVGMHIRETAVTSDLPVGYKQFVEIAREIDKEGIKLVVFDEPTAVLTESESNNLLGVIQTITQMGVAVIFISHKLEEVMRVADHVIVMRDGEVVSTVRKSDTNVVKLAEMMVGRSIDANLIAVPRDFSDAPTIMNLKDFQVNMPGENIKGINLEIKKGEIIGLGGLAGQGKLGVINGIMGLCEASGQVWYKDELLKLNTPKDPLKKRIAFVSEDRKGVGLLLDESIEDNIAIPAISIHGMYLKKIGFFTQVDKKAVRKQSGEMIQALKIKCTNGKQKVRALSGGNQQKVCMAKALTQEPEMLLVAEPTRGIDIGAKQVLLDYLVKLNREEGMTIVITSSELHELRSICDRVAIISEGKIEAILSPGASEADFGLAMSGEYLSHRAVEVE